jgi:hypothetical protein
VAAEIIAATHKLKDLLQPRVDLSIQELIDSCLPEKQEFYEYHPRGAFKWVQKNRLRTKKEYSLVDKKHEAGPKMKTEVVKSNPKKKKNKKNLTFLFIITSIFHSSRK